MKYLLLMFMSNAFDLEFIEKAQYGNDNFYPLS